MVFFLSPTMSNQARFVEKHSKAGWMVPFLESEFSPLDVQPGMWFERPTRFAYWTINI